MQRRSLVIIGMMCVATAWRASAAEALLPLNRTAYRADEAIELAIAGVGKGAHAEIQVVAQDGERPDVANTLRACVFTIDGDGSTVDVLIPAGALAPAHYRVRIDGAATACAFVVVSAVSSSSMVLSATFPTTSANAVVANILGNGILDEHGMPAVAVRGRRGQAMTALDKNLADNLPSLIYMYWEGYITHKPWGNFRSWGAPEMQQCMRQVSFHSAQLARRFGTSILYLGGIDEPGLTWGPVPGHPGKETTGWPWKDAAQAYAKYGWQWNDNPAAQSVEEWNRFIEGHTRTMGDIFAQARRDCHAVWPEAVFSQDIYACEDLGDGVEPWNQRENDQPATHTFSDWINSLHSSASSYDVVKCAEPTALLNIAQNGHCAWADNAPPEQSIAAYRALIDQNLMVGMRCCWWLSTGGVAGPEIDRVNAPVLRYGPMLENTTDTAHDIAMLWGASELSLRLKDANAKQAADQSDTITAELPANPFLASPATLSVDAGGIMMDYGQTVSYAHAALMRAGFPADILHERLLAPSALDHYRTLVIVAQTHPLPRVIRQAIDAFTAKGGTVVLDWISAKTLALDGAVVSDADLDHLGLRKGALLNPALEDVRRKRDGAKKVSYFSTNYFIESFTRAAVAPLRQSMLRAGRTPIVLNDTTDLLCAQRQAGEGRVVMVLNAHEEMPEIADDQAYWWTNNAPLKTEFALTGLAKSDVVYQIAGVDWQDAALLPNPSARAAREFAPGEMKLFLIAPRAPTSLTVGAAIDHARIAVSATLDGLKMPWPLTVIVLDPNGAERYRVQRATDTGGAYAESFPIGDNAAAGSYSVRIESPLAALHGQARVTFASATMAPKPLTELARVFDDSAIRAFYAAKPRLTIALGDDRYRAQAQRLADGLRAVGITAVLRPESEVVARATYPRVFNPFVYVFSDAPEQKFQEPEGMIEHATVEMRDDGQIVATADHGSVLSDWRAPHSVLTVVGKGLVTYADDERLYEAGCVLAIDGDRRISVLRGAQHRVDATPEIKQRLAHPWTTLVDGRAGFLPPMLPMAYHVDGPLILIGDSEHSELVRALQASEILPQIADAVYPGPGKALIEYAWSPFALDQDAIFIGASDAAGVDAGIARLLTLGH